MKCKICKKVEADGYVNGIECCSLCQFIIKKQKTAIGHFINSLAKNKTRSQTYLWLFIKQYPELYKNNSIKKTDLENIRQDIVFEYKKICLKMSKNW